MRCVLLKESLDSFNNVPRYSGPFNNGRAILSKTVRGATGRYETTSVVGGERVKAFIPFPLPPDPPLHIDAALRDKLDAALLALGRLDSVTTLLPDTHLFL